MKEKNLIPKLNEAKEELIKTKILNSKLDITDKLLSINNFRVVATNQCKIWLKPTEEFNNAEKLKSITSRTKQDLQNALRKAEWLL